MTDERAKEIAERMRAHLGSADVVLESDQLLLKLYDDIQALKASAAATSFLHASIQPVRRADG